MHDQSSHSRRQALAMLASGAAALALSAAVALRLKPIASAKAAEPPRQPAAVEASPFDLVL